MTSIGVLNESNESALRNIESLNASPLLEKLPQHISFGERTRIEELINDGRTNMVKHDFHTKPEKPIRQLPRPLLLAKRQDADKIIEE